MKNSQDRPGNSSKPKSNPDLLIEQLEERALFDAVPIMPIDANSVDVDPVAYLDTVIEAVSSDAQAGTNEQESRNEILFVDKSVEGYETLVADFLSQRDADVVFINDSSDGLTQIADHLQNRSNLEAIHIISHGKAGQLNLGDAEIQSQDLSSNYATELVRIGQALGENGDILIYGCELAGSADGEHFIQKLSEMTGADIAASDDLTGSAGDWALEKNVGHIEADVFTANDYTGNLLVTDAGFVVGTAPFSGIDEIAVTPLSEGGVSSRLYAGAATAAGGTITIDLQLTLIDTYDELGNVTTGTVDQMPVTFTNFMGAPIILARNVGASVSGFQGHTAHILVEFYDQSTGNPLSVVGDFTFKDIDYIGPADADPGKGSEAITVVSDQMQSYSVSNSPTTSLVSEDNPDGTTTFTNYTSSGTENDEERWVSVTFLDMPQLNLRFDARNGNTGYGLSTANFSVTPISYTPPIAQDDVFTTDQDSSISGNVVTTDNGNGVDTDPDGDPLSVTLVDGVAGNVGSSVTGSSGGTFVINSDGSYTFDPGSDFDYLDAGESTTTSVTYQIGDGTGLADNATVTVTVNGFNDAPTNVGTIADQTNDDNETITALDASTYFNEVDISDSLTFSDGGTLPPGLSIDPGTGVISGTIDNSASLTGPYSVVITASDGTFSTSQSFTWTVLNPGPTATANTGVVNENNAINTETGNVITDNDGFGEDSDPDNDVLNVSSFEGSAANVGITVNGLYGDIQLNSDGTYTYTLDNNNVTVNALDNGDILTDVFNYTVSDGEGGFDSSTLTITINGDNDAPVVGGTIPPQSNMDADTIATLDASTYFSDPEGQTLSYSATGLPTGLMINPSSGLVTGTIDNSASQGGPASDGVYSIDITADDGNGGTVTTTFSWTIGNPGPVANNDFDATTQSTNATGNAITDLAGADSDADGDTITVNEVNGAAGSVGVVVTGSNGGEFVINTNGSYTFNPNGDFDALADGETQTTSVTYTITDSEGGTDTATLEVTVTGENDAPTTVGTLPNQADTDATTSISLDTSGYFADVDATDSFTYSATGLPTGLSINPTTGEIAGTVDNSASQGGPASDGVYSVTVTVDDGNGGTVDQTFSWVITNPAPVAVNDIDSVTNQVNTVSGNALTNDSDPDGDALTIIGVGTGSGNLPGNVGVALNATNGGTFTVQADGSFVFDPDGDFDNLAAGESAFTAVYYDVSDGEGGVTEAMIWATVNGTNDAPTGVGTIPNQANADAEAITTIDTSTYFSDVDTSDTLAYSVSGLPAGLSFSTTNGQITGTLDNSASQGGPASDGVYTVTVTADDGNGGTVDQVFTWTVSNPGPVANNDSGSTDEATSISGDVITASDSDPDGDLITVNEVNGAAGNVGTVVAGSNGGQFTINSDGSYSFDPNSEFEGLKAGETQDTSINYTITDSEGGTASATLTVTVNGLNDTPTAGAIPAQSDMDADTITPIDVSTVFSDPDGDTLTYTATGLPTGLMLDLNSGIISGTIDNSASQGGPASDGVYSIDVTADDGNGGTVTTTFSWTVANPGPIANNDSDATTQSANALGNVITDVAGADIDADGDTITVNEVNGMVAFVGTNVAGSNGGEFTINSDGSYTFNPNGDFDTLADGETQTTSVTYTITDSEGGTDTATLEVTVTGENDDPTGVGSIPLQVNLDADAIATIDTSMYFNDIDATDTLTYSVSGLPAGLSFNTTNGQISGTLDNSASQGGPLSDGVYTVTVTANDSNGGTVDQVFTWTVTNPGPVAVDDSGSTDEATSIAGDVITASDSDPDADIITVNEVNGVPGDVGMTVTRLQRGSIHHQQRWLLHV